MEINDKNGDNDNNREENLVNNNEKKISTNVKTSKLRSRGRGRPPGSGRKRAPLTLQEEDRRKRLNSVRNNKITLEPRKKKKCDNATFNNLVTETQRKEKTT